MKQLDRFSRFQKGVHGFLVYLAIVGMPIGATLVADRFWLKELPSLVRYPLLAVCMIVGFVLAIGMIAGPVEDCFKGLRKFLGMKPLYEMEKEIREERENAELSEEERKRRWFASLSEIEQRYSLWAQQKRQSEHLEAISTSLETIKFLLIGLLVFFVIRMIF